ncbi:hypothetical protein EV121DRAFT_297312 [Schizophyllum commune]
MARLRQELESIAPFLPDDVQATPSHYIPHTPTYARAPLTPGLTTRRRAPASTLAHEFPVNSPSNPLYTSGSRRDFTDYVGCQTLRNGKTFSQYYIVPNKNFNLDTHGLAAAARERDEPPPPAADDGDEDDWEDIDDLSPLSSAPLTPWLPQLRPPRPLRLTQDPPRRSPPSPPSPHHLEHLPDPYAIRQLNMLNQAKKRKAGTHAPTLRDCVHHQARRVADAEAQIVSIDLDDIPVASTGFRGLYEEEIHQTYTHKQLVEKHNFFYFPWDASRNPRNACDRL